MVYSLCFKHFMIYREAKKKSNFACKGLCQLIVQLILLLPFLLKNCWEGHRTKEPSILVSLKNTERWLTRALFQNGLEVYPEVTAFHPRAVVRNNDGKAWYKTRVGHLLSLPPILKMGLMVVLIAVFVDVKETRVHSPLSPCNSLHCKKNIASLVNLPSILYF